MLRELADVTHKWYYIGLELGLKSGDLDPIQQQSSDSLAKACEMANWWLKNARQPTWLALADALSSPTVNEAQKAKELRQKMQNTNHKRRKAEASEKKLKLTSGDSVLVTPGMLQYPSMLSHGFVSNCGCISKFTADVQYCMIEPASCY